MSYYVIGIGGTGAKCIEALAHLCAAGLMPDGELYSVFVDPDRANGSLERAEITLRQYVNCKQLNLGATDIFKTRLFIAEPDVWSPFEDESQPRLDNFFRYNNLKSAQKEIADLFDVLYSTDEKTTGLEEGFRGHPSIGAAVMATTLKLGGNEPWKTFRDKIAQDIKAKAGAKIILVGSIFGGTGASGIPTIARLIREELKGIGQQKAQLGSVLVLPYFSFPAVPGDMLKANSDNFLLNTQAALQYYSQQDYMKTYDAVYLLGDHNLSPVNDESIGGRTQRNEPHFMELYAALACVDFFREDISGYQMIARRDQGSVSWDDMPYSPGSTLLKEKLDALARFAFAYLCSYYPMLDYINKHGRGYQAPWYINFFERKNIPLAAAMQTDLPKVKGYCESFLLWLANVQSSAKDLNVNLINYQAFARKQQQGDKNLIALLPETDFLITEFSNLTLPITRKDSNALSGLWERMSEAEVQDKDANGIGALVHALYREAAKK
jgi:hypothetical protein